MSTREGGNAKSSANSLWRSRVRDSADRIALRFSRAGAWESLTWGQADQAVREIAAGLLALGLARGDRVALLSQTRLEWLLCDVAIATAGLVSVPIYPSSTSEQCAFIIEDSGASTVIAEDGQQIAKLGALRTNLPPVRVICIEAAPTNDGSAETMPSLSALRQAGRTWIAANPGVLELQADAVKPSDCCRSRISWRT